MSTPDQVHRSENGEGLLPPRWHAESPFQNGYAAAAAPTPERSTPTLARFSSPFLNELALPGPLGEASATRDAVAEFLTDVYDEEFDDAASELMDEAWQVAGARALGEYGDEAGRDARLQRLLAEHFEPLVRHGEDMLGQMAEELGHLDALSIGELAFDEALERYTAPTVSLPPSFEHFLGGLLSKAKKAVKGAISLAKRGVGTVARLAGGPIIKLLLDKLKGYVRPLLQRLIAFAQRKVPAAYAPAIAALAARFGLAPTAAASPTTADPAAPTADAGSTSATEPPAHAAATEPAAPDAAELQSELDQTLLQSLLARDEAEGEVADRGYAERARVPEPDAGTALEKARDRFVSELGELAEADDPRPAIENFLPAVLPALRLGIKLAGRERILGVIAGVVTPLIAPIVGPASKPLGRLLADLGLRTLLQSEVGSSDPSDAAGRAIAATVEEVVRHVSGLPDAVLADEPELEAQLQEAFDAAAAANFPASVVRPELREMSTGDGAWLQLPARGPRKEFKAYSQTFDVELTPQLARSIHTYGGSTLHSFLRDRLRVSADAPVRARLYLYEALPGTRPSRVARLDRRLGLEQVSDAARLFHPLTPQAALGLLREPRLGRRTHPGARPSQLAVGQRFYYLQVQGSRLSRSRESHLRLRLDFVRDEARVHLFIAEPIAQELLSMLRRRAPAAALANRLRSVFANEVQALQSGVRGGMVKVVLGGSPARSASVDGAASEGATRALLQQVERVTVEWAWRQVLEYFKQGAAGFAAATERPEDGVSLNVVFRNPPGFSAVRRVLEGGRSAALQAWPPTQMPAASLAVTVGHARI